MMRYAIKELKQTGRENADRDLKSCAPTDRCKKLRDAIRAAEDEVAARSFYVNNGCDEFDYYKKGTTRAEREAKHRKEIMNRNKRIEELKKAYNNECQPNAHGKKYSQ